MREYCGYGTGREMYEEPQVLHYGRANEGLVLRAGMTFTKDKKLSAQWEHTILVIEVGYEVLTLRDEERKV